MNEEQLKALQDALAKTVPAVIDEALDAKIKTLSEKAATDMEEIQAEIKKLTLAGKQTAEVKELGTKAAIVSIFKNVVNQDIKSEAQFKSIVEKEVKALPFMNETTATEGAELVFDQFSADILKVINSYELVSSVKTLQLAKGDKLSLPKVTNWVTTEYVTEGTAGTESEPTTSFVTIDIFETFSMVDFSQNILDDAMTIPDLYNLIVEMIWESQAEFMENEILNGAGGTAIEGILVNSSVNVITMANGDISVDDISDAYLVQVITKALRKFKRNPSKVKWIMSQYVYWKLMALKTTTGQPLYPELRNFSSPSLMGYGVIISDKSLVQNVAGDAVSTKVLAFGDLSYFLLVSRKDLTLERGYYGDNWKKSVVSVKANKRIGWKPTFGEAFTVLKTAAA